MLNSIQTGKLALILLLGPVTFLVSLLPWLLSHRHESLQVSLEIGSAASAGVILGAAFSHILPDAQAAFEQYIDESSNLKTYPYAEFICVGTLFVLLCIDKLVVDRIIHQQRKESMDKDFQLEDGENIELSCTAPVNQNSSHPSFHNHFSSALSESGHQHLKHLRTAYIFLIALSIHSIFDGLAVGSEDTIEGFYGLLIAVVIHKLLDGFALGIPIFYAKFSKAQSCIALAFCASMTPLGIIIGWMATEVINGQAGMLTRGIFSSMSLGSFLYIGLIELLPAGLQSPVYIEIKLGAAIFGWGIMALIAAWV